MKITTELMLSVQGNTFSIKVISFVHDDPKAFVLGESPDGSYGCYFDVARLLQKLALLTVLTISPV